MGLPPSRESAVVCDSLSVVDGGRCPPSPVCRPAGLVPAAGGLKGLLGAMAVLPEAPEGKWELLPCATGRRSHVATLGMEGWAVHAPTVRLRLWRACRWRWPGGWAILCSPVTCVGLPNLVAAGWIQAQGPTGQESGPECRKQCDPAWRRKTEARLDLGCQEQVAFKPKGRGSFRMRTGSEVVQGASEG